jgi:hypothetical protein
MHLERHALNSLDGTHSLKMEQPHYNCNNRIGLVITMGASLVVFKIRKKAHRIVSEIHYRIDQSIHRPTFRRLRVGILCC